MKEISKEFARKTLAVLRHKHMAIGEFEMAVGISEGTLSRVKRGESHISLDTALEIAGVFDTDIYEILNFDEEEAKRTKIRQEIERLRAEADALEKSIATE